MTREILRCLENVNHAGQMIFNVHNSKFTLCSTFSFVWPAMDGVRVVCLSIHLEGGVTVSNNFTKRRQNGFKMDKRQVRDTFEVGKLYFN